MIDFSTTSTVSYFVSECSLPSLAIRTRLVLPHRLDAELEEVVARVALKLQWRFERIRVTTERSNSLMTAEPS